MGFGIAKFRIAKFSHCEFGIARFSHCEIGIGSVNSKLALRNGIWHCEISHCEIDFGIAKWHLALRNFALRNFRIANFGLRNFRIAKWVCEIFALRNGSANSLRKSLFADFPSLSSCLQLHLIIFTFPSIFH